MKNLQATFVWIENTRIKVQGKIAVSDAGNGLLRFELLEDITKTDDCPTTRRYWAAQLGGTVNGKHAKSVTAAKGTVFYSHSSFAKVIRTPPRVGTVGCRVP